MHLISRSAVVLLVLALSSLHASSDSRYITFPAGHQDKVTTNRHLLQVLTPCPVNFQVQNYTIITSECKGPQYPVNACCPAFVKFACPFAGEINDNTTNCASTMFTYITIYGRYPPGLFANECTGTDKGLPCPANSTVESSHAGQRLHYKRLRFWWSVSVICTVLLLHLHWSG